MLYGIIYYLFFQQNNHK